jgi:hypothetical protein
MRSLEHDILLALLEIRSVRSDSIFRAISDAHAMALGSHKSPRFRSVLSALEGDKLILRQERGNQFFLSKTGLLMLAKLECAEEARTQGSETVTCNDGPGKVQS